MVFKSSARSYVECITLCTTYTHVYSKVDTKRQRTARFIYRIQPPSNNHSNMVFVFTLSMSFRGQWTCPSLMSGIPPIHKTKTTHVHCIPSNKYFLTPLHLKLQCSCVRHGLVTSKMLQPHELKSGKSSGMPHATVQRLLVVIAGVGSWGERIVAFTCSRWRV